MSKPELCAEQAERTESVEHALKKMKRHLERDRIATVFSLHVCAFNCANQRHQLPDSFHCDYVAGGSGFEVPNSLEGTIKALEHALVELRKRVQ